MHTVSNIVSSVVSNITGPILTATWFDGSDDAVNISSLNFGSTDTLTFRGQSMGGSGTFISSALGTDRIFFDATDVFSVRINNDGTFAWDLSTTDITVERTYKIVRSGTSATLYVDGVSQGEVTGGDSSNLPMTQFGNKVGYITTILALNGVIYDTKLQNSSGLVINSWLGNKNTTAAWADLVGAKNGTLAGSPAEAAKTGIVWVSN